MNDIGKEFLKGVEDRAEGRRDDIHWRHAVERSVTAVERALSGAGHYEKYLPPAEGSVVAEKADAGDRAVGP